MKKVYVIVLLFIAGSYTSASFAQTKQHTATKIHVQTKTQLPKHRPDSLKQTTSITGQTGAWMSNDEYVFNGFYLQTSTENQLVKIPLHMGSRLTAIVKTGKTVSVNGVVNVTPTGGKEIYLVSVTVDGETIYD